MKRALCIGVPALLLGVVLFAVLRVALYAQEDDAEHLELKQR